MNKKYGISLIVLVIMVFVMLIVAGTVIVGVSDNNPVKRANEAREKANFREYASELEVNHVKKESAIVGYKRENINTIDPEEVEKYIPSMDKNKAYYYAIAQGQLCYRRDLEEGRPYLLQNMTPIKWNLGKEVETTIEDKSWYNYDEREWPNAKTTDGSYFVWIPRFEYKITYDDSLDKSDGGKIDINIISKVQVKPTEGYKIHPAFRNGTDNKFANGEWDTELSGIWVAKYEASKNQNTSAPISIPNAKPWTDIDIKEVYEKALEYDKENESHMLKNSEWGAVTYFTHSKYGRNQFQVEKNTSEAMSTADGDPYANVSKSSTGNITGIYDLNGGAWEYVASYIDNGNLNVKELGGAMAADLNSSKYSTVYPRGNADNATENYKVLEGIYLERYGDALVETSSAGHGKSTFFKNTAAYMHEARPFIARGGTTNMGDDSGMFAYEAKTGEKNSLVSFRMTLCKF